MCENHFKDDDFVGATERKRLKRSAVPLNYKENHHQSFSDEENLEVMKPSKVYSKTAVPLFTHLSHNSYEQTCPEKTDFPSVSAILSAAIDFPEPSRKPRRFRNEAKNPSKLLTVIRKQAKIIKSLRVMIAKLRKTRNEKKRYFRTCF